MRQLLHIVVTVLFISGCDQVKNTADKMMMDKTQQPAIVITGGYEINDHGHLKKVYGPSNCPSQPVVTDFINKKGCITVNSEDKSVSVLVSEGEVRSLNETWAVERHGGFPNNFILFKHQDNSFVIPFNTGKLENE